MVLMAGLELPARSIREQIASAVHLVVHLSRMGDGTRRITEIAEVSGMAGDSITLSTLFGLEVRHTGSGAGLGALQATDLVPSYVSGLRPMGQDRRRDLERAFPEGER